jgi:ABC-type dipeptide/oligopeptide/nickel transport system permease subunit
MTTDAIAVTEDQAWQLPAERSRLQDLARTARRNPLGVFGAIVVVLFIFLGIFGPMIAPYDPTQEEIGASSQFAGPSWAHPFGQDKLGQDILSRTIAGARISFVIGFAAVALGVAGGSMMGVISGYYGGLVDSFIQRTGEAGAAFPGLFLYLMLIAAMGRGQWTIITGIAIFAFIGGSRVLRALTIVIKHSTFVEASRSMGATETRILLTHVLPNVMPIIIVVASGAIGGAILAEAALSFLGIGVEPGTPSWGADLNANYETAATLGQWHLIAASGTAISLVVLGFNLLGDTLRDVLDPRLRGSLN